MLGRREDLLGPCSVWGLGLLRRVQSHRCLRAVGHLIPDSDDKKCSDPSVNYVPGEDKCEAGPDPPQDGNV